MFIFLSKNILIDRLVEFYSIVFEGGDFDLGGISVGESNF